MSIETKFGKCYINKGGYYTTTSSNKKLLHRLVWEDFYNMSVPKGYNIHHINGNKLDNRIQNLQCVEHNTHAKYHSTGRTQTEEAKAKVSKALTGKPKSEEHKANLSKALTGKMAGDKNPMYGTTSPAFNPIMNFTKCKDGRYDKTCYGKYKRTRARSKDINKMVDKLESFIYSDNNLDRDNPYMGYKLPNGNIVVCEDKCKITFNFKGGDL